MPRAGQFVTAICCIDGRIQDSISQWLKSRYGAAFVDTITEPGVDRLLAEDAYHEEVVRRKAIISVEGHHSRLIAIVGHFDCAANPVSKIQHIKQIRIALARVAGWDFPEDVEVVGLWVGEDGKVEVVE